MNQNQIKEINKGIPYNEGKIIFALNKGYTSNTMQYLQKCGYTTVVHGTVHCLYDDAGREVTTGYTWVELLYNTAIVMR